MSDLNREDEEQRKNSLNHCWVAYIYPFCFVVPDHKEPLEVTLEEINKNSYDYGKLSSIVGTFPIVIEDIKDYRMVVCYDGALAVPQLKAFALKEQAISYFNQIFCNLLIGGVYCEAIDTRDVVWGQLHIKKFIYPVNIGESVSSQLHGSLRLKLAGPLQTIMLSDPRIIRLSDFDNALKTGAYLTSSIRNLTPEFLIRGTTELRYRNWSAALSNLWITVEQLTEYLWHAKFLNDGSKHPRITIPGRLKTLRGDSRTWSIAVKQEILYQDGLISEETFAKIYPARQARNNLVHNGKNVNSEIAFGVFEGVCKLLESCCEDSVDIRLEHLINRKSIDDHRPRKSSLNDDYFQDWLSLK